MTLGAGLIAPIKGTLHLTVTLLPQASPRLFAKWTQRRAPELHPPTALIGWKGTMDALFWRQLSVHWMLESLNKHCLFPSKELRVL